MSSDDDQLWRAPSREVQDGSKRLAYVEFFAYRFMIYIVALLRWLLRYGRMTATVDAHFSGLSRV